MARGWKFWRKVFTAACYSSIMSIQITSSIVAPIFAIAGPGFGLTTSEVAQVFSVYYLPNVGSSLAARVALRPPARAVRRLHRAISRLRRTRAGARVLLGRCG